MTYVLIVISLYFNIGFSQEFATKDSCLDAVKSIRSDARNKDDFGGSHWNRVRFVCVPKGESK